MRRSLIPIRELSATIRQRCEDAPSIQNSRKTEPIKETLVDRVGRAKARWLKRVMYETTATSTEKCFAYAIVDHLNCVTLDCWPSQARFARLLGFKCVKTAQRAARGLEKLGVLTLKRSGKNGYRYAPVLLPGDEDRVVHAIGQARPARPDKDVRESLLPIQVNLSASTEAAGQGSNEYRSAAPVYDPRQRGAIEIKIAALLGSRGLDALARLASLDNQIVDRLCRAYATGDLGEREVAAARLAAEQIT